MIKFTPKTFILITFLTVSLSSCTSLKKTMREPNVRVDLTMSDFSLSDQFTAEATSTKIVGIDFSRLYLKEEGEITGGPNQMSISIPVIGNVVSNKTANFALYKLMQENPGYDVVFYPQYETSVVKPVMGIGFIKKISTVKVTCRLGSLNE